MKQVDNGLLGLKDFLKSRDVDHPDLQDHDIVHGLEACFAKFQGFLDESSNH